MRIVFFQRRDKKRKFKFNIDKNQAAVEPKAQKSINLQFQHVTVEDHAVVDIVRSNTFR